jgi:Uma2 family endonuclease
MSIITQSVPPRTPVYPESDGEPMAENTRQFEYITTVKGGLDAQFRDDPNVFVAGDLFWYPVEGEPNTRAAPDVMVAFGRPKGHRGSYLQWQEGGIAPQVVFEIWSPGNRYGEMTRKFDFFQRYGVEEYYLFDPQTGDLCGWLRKGDRLDEISDMAGWMSPRLHVRFEVVDGELLLHGPDGTKFASYLELVEQAAKLKKQSEEERQRAGRLEAQLRSLGINPEA